ncbi:MAG: peptidylprolyl isomerase [Bradymonadia bacterium]
MSNYRKIFSPLVVLTALSFGCEPKSAGHSQTASKAQEEASHTTKPPTEKKITKTQSAKQTNQNAVAKKKKPTPRQMADQSRREPKAPTPDPKAPERYRVRLETTKGPVDIDVTRAWSPRGADRFYRLVKTGYYTDVAFFRVIKGFMAQTGLSGNPDLSNEWGRASIKDDPVVESNQRGMVTFATRGPNTRSMQFFINFKNNSFLDKQGFSPFGRVSTAGLAVIDQLNGEYGEGAPRGRGPSQALIRQKGNAYLKAQFPKLDYIKSARVVPVVNTAPAKTAPQAPVKQTVQDGKSTIIKPGGEVEAPANFRARFTTTKGQFDIQVTKSWAPKGADRFYNLIKKGYYNNTAFFRVIKGFMAQVGMHGDPNTNRLWRNATIKDDPVKQRNLRGYVTFAKTGRPNSRTTQFFINFGDNSRLDGMGFAPIGKIDAAGMKVVDALHSGYGEGAPRGRGPQQGQLAARGNPYLKEYFPKLDYIIRAEIVQGAK